MDEFTRAYIACALWSSNDESNESGGEPLDANYDIDDLAPETLKTIEEDCQNFQNTYKCLLEEAYRLYFSPGGYAPAEQAGHDFWLTRNGHGAGFWDRGLGDVGDKLSEAARLEGSRDLYVADDGRLYIQ